MHRRSTATLVSVLMLAGVSRATDWYVNDNGPGDPGPGDPTVSDPMEDGTLAHPWDAIQEAIDCPCVVEGDTIYVQPGFYGDAPGANFNNNLRFHGKRITVRGDGPPLLITIDGGGTDPAFIFDGGETADSVVENLTVSNCAGSAIQCDSTTPTFNGVHFISNSGALGGAASLTLADMTFTGCEFRENSASSRGGAVYALSSDAVFEDCTFMDNTAEEGGAAHMLSNADATFGNCTFESNDATLNGGALFVDNSSDVTVSDSTLTGNTAGADGGAAYLDRGSSLDADDVRFMQNVATSGDGGGILLEDSTADLAGGDLTGNTALNGRGGGLAGRNGSSVVATGVAIDGNVAGISGAGVLNDGGSADLSNCLVTFNQCPDRGAGLLNLASDSVTVASCTFTGNVVTAMGGRGGGVSNGRSTATITDSIFEENQAAFGGGVHNVASVVRIASSDFERNTGAGGGIFNGSTDGIGTDAHILFCTFVDNSTTANGGAIHSKGEPADPDDRIVIHNCLFVHNVARDAGGAIHCDAGNVTEVANSAFSRNSVEWVGGGGSGGAIRAEESEVRVVNSSFSRNHADQFGGGVSLDVGATMDIDNSILWENDDSAGTTFEAQIHLNPACAPACTVDFEYSSVMNLPAVPPPGAGDGLTDLDPLFVDATLDNLRLDPNSPCIDAGRNAEVPADVLDLDGNMDLVEPLPLDLEVTHRFHDDPAVGDCPYVPPGSCGAAPIVEMGAYELCPADFDGDGDGDLGDLSTLLAHFGTLTGMTRADGDVDGDGAVDLTDLSYLLTVFGGC